MVQGKEKTMSEKRDIILRLRSGHSIRKIGRELGVHRTVIRSVHRLAAEKGWLNLETTPPSEHELDQASIQEKTTTPETPLTAYCEEIKMWHSEGKSAVVIQRLLERNHSILRGIGSLRRYIRKNFPKVPDPIMTRTASPGEVMDVDFGFLGMLEDGTPGGKPRKAWVFSARLRYSRKAYREIVFRQDSMQFNECHIHAFEHFNGVPQQVVLDNLKAGVIKSTIDNDMINRSYRDLAEHYGFMISPCLPRTPQHKGGVENDVGYIKKSFWPEFTEKLKSSPHTTIHEAQKEIERWDREVASSRKLRDNGRSPEELFRDEEQKTLKPLPQERAEITQWFECLVRKDWTILLQGSRYSVPYGLIEKCVQIRATTKFVKVFFEHQEVASHQKATQKGMYIRCAGHAPPFKEEVLTCNRQGLLTQAKELGENVFKLTEQILSNRSVDKLKPVRHLLRLSQKYGKDRLDRACARALQFNITLYHGVKDILRRGLDSELLIEPRPSQSKVVPFRYAREACEYQSETKENPAEATATACIS